jgi:dTDP-4-dehydrorhamnose reductase
VKIVVTGAGGQLGRELLGVFGDNEVVALTSADLDITDAAAVMGRLAAERPALVLNAAAYTKVDASEETPAPAWGVNAAGAWHLALVCREIGATLVHVSTDYVFDGMKGRPYTEFDRTRPVSVYGRTKEAGEQLVRETLDRHYIVRTSWLHGPHGANFLRTMLRLGRERDQVSVVDDQVGCPTFAEDLARSIVELIGTGAYGTYHRTNTGSCTWYDLARAAFDWAGIAAEVVPISTEQYGAPAPRPGNSVLDNTKSNLLGLDALPPWQDSLDRFLTALA